MIMEDEIKRAKANNTVYF